MKTMSQFADFDFSRQDLEVITHALERPWQPIENLTRNYYFKVVRYALSGIDATVLNLGEQQRVEMKKQMQHKANRLGLNPDIFVTDDVLAYNKYTIGWVGDAIDNFGTIKNPDCPYDFQIWFEKYAYNGGHPFEIFPYICLYVRRKKGKFYLELADFRIAGDLPTEKVLKMFLAVQRAGISVALRDKEFLLKKLHKYDLKMH